MFVEGIYLILVVYCTFQAEKLRFWTYALIGWGIPCLLTISRIVFDCVYNPGKEISVEPILDTRKVALLVHSYKSKIQTMGRLDNPLRVRPDDEVNVIFLVAILYALNEKLRRGLTLRRPTSNSPNIEEQNAVRITDEPVPHPGGRGSCPLSLAISVVESQHHPNVVNGGLQTITFKRNYRPACCCGSSRARTIAQPDSLKEDNAVSYSRRRANSLFVTSPDISHVARAKGSIRMEILGLRLWRMMGRLNSREFIKTVKAGLTLMPLLGLPEVIFITPYHPTLKPAFELINAFFTSTQGFWVALLYCFLTIEVRREFKKRQRTRSMRLSLRSSRRLT
ncbi:uncharacterized protein DEA37_0009942 [Paragonimus westermani]|uniref:G-protein coupled receptors family 2 profile 2 domain-containing protein n=1 Tax=Paragonimus westermani TaxID=34504 RepID=A0A5J4NKF4_9TREM|nr:uncharacterized protein DEA37_0009942 [Paragonimus westermani]